MATWGNAGNLIFFLRFLFLYINFFKTFADMKDKEYKNLIYHTEVDNNMGMEILGTAQVKATEAPIKPANQGGTALANTAPVSAPVQPAMKPSMGNGTGENQEQSGKDGQATEKQIQAAIEHVKRASQMSRTRCEFSYHEATKRVSIKVLDDETNEVIKEIPPEKSLEMVEKMWELAGILVDEKR